MDIEILNKKEWIYRQSPVKLPDINKKKKFEPKKWGLFAIVGIYSSGVKMTLKI